MYEYEYEYNEVFTKFLMTLILYAEKCMLRREAHELYQDLVFFLYCKSNPLFNRILIYVSYLRLLCFTSFISVIRVHST
jgi:hypothetical protein